MEANDVADVIDRVAGIEPTSAVGALRRERPEILHRSQTSYQAALQPNDPGTLSFAERAPLACRMAQLLKNAKLKAHYAVLLTEAGAEQELRDLADPEHRGDIFDPRRRAIARHVDLITATPENATRGDIQKLQAAGLNDRDVVTLAGLIAFVNYQARVIAGLRMLGGR
jgi:CMD domain protein